MRAKVGLAFAALAVGLVVAAGALAASKPPKFVDCISGDTQAGKPSAGGTGNCALIPDAVANGQMSGLDIPLAVAVSPDGESVYSAQEGDASVAEFKRNPKTGKLSYMGCISGSDALGPTGTGACKLIPSHTPNGIGSGLAGLRGIVVSPDGKSVYTVASATFPEDDAIATFERNKNTGRLTYDACIAGNAAVGPAGTDACKMIPRAATEGIGSGLDRPRDLVVSGDGRSVYGVSATDADVFWLSRAGDGKLTWQGCLTGNTVTAKGTGTGACNAVPHPSVGGSTSGVGDPEFALISPDDQNVYVSSRADDAIATFERGKQGSKLTFQRCLTGSDLAGPSGQGGSGACAATGTSTSNGAASGLSRLYALAVSADGRSLYSVAASDDAVDTFKRSPKTGKIRFKACITGDLAAGPAGGGGTGACRAVPKAVMGGGFSGLSGESSIALHGRKVLGLASNDSAAQTFTRSKKTGKLTYRGCLTSSTDVGPAGSNACKAMPRIGPNSGLTSATYLAMSPGGDDAYVAGASNDAIVRLSP